MCPISAMHLGLKQCLKYASPVSSAVVWGPDLVGQNGVGQLGDGTTRDRSIPVPMITPWGRATVAIAVAAGFSHFVVLAGVCGACLWISDLRFPELHCNFEWRSGNWLIRSPLFLSLRNSSDNFS